MTVTQEEIIEAKRAIRWKANLYALVAEVLDDAEAGDPLAMRIVTSAGLADPLRLVQREDK